MPEALTLIYDSMTGNVRRFVAQLQGTPGLPALAAQTVQAAEPQGGYLLLTYTFGSGEVPTSTAQFLERHHRHLRGVVASGSFHWGERFGRAGDVIAAQYGVPLVARLNKGGSDADRQAVAAWLMAQLHRTPHVPVPTKEPLWTPGQP